MLCIEGRQKEIDDCRDNLLRCCEQAKERARIGRVSDERLKTIDDELRDTVAARDNLRNAINHLVSIYKNIEQYAQDRRELSLDLLKMAVDKAGYVVPNADTEGIRLCTENGKAKIVSKDGQDINLREGSAYRTTMGMLIRHTLIKEQPNCIQAVFFDEAFGTLSDESTSSLREYFDAFKEDILIVCIEQHDTLFQGLNKQTIKAVKGDDGVTVILSEDGDSNGETD